MKRFFVFLILGLLAIIAYRSYLSFLRINKTSIPTKNLSKSEIIDSANNYLVNKYGFTKDSIELINYKEIFFNDPKTGISKNNRTDLLYRIEGNQEMLVVCHWPKSNAIFTDNYQAKDISGAVSNYFKSLLGNSTISVDFLFYPKTASRSWMGLYNTDSFLNKYKNNIEEFFEDEYLKEVNMVIPVDKSEKEAALSEYSSKLKKYAENYCSKLDKWSDKKETSFEIFLFDKNVSVNPLSGSKGNGFFNQDTGKYIHGLLCRYFYVCNTPNYDVNNIHYVYGECFEPSEVSDF